MKACNPIRKKKNPVTQFEKMEQKIQLEQLILEQ
jgi:hypothetical protein